MAPTWAGPGWFNILSIPIRFRLLYRTISLGLEQAGNGPCRRHIQGSKIAKGHESVKNKLTSVKVSNPRREDQTHKKLKRSAKRVDIHCCKTSKNLRGDPSVKKVSMPEKAERGTLWDFSASILSQNIKKWKGPFGEFFEK